MPDYGFNRRTHDRFMSQNARLNNGTFIYLFLILTSFLISEITYAKPGYAIRNDLFSISFPNEREGWACGRWGTVLHTDDGGKSWILQDSSTDYTLASIFFTDPQNGWAVGQGGTIINTSDGGKSWVKQKCPVDYFLMGVCFVNEQKGWAVTEWTTILHTEDGGKKWQIQFTGIDNILKSVSFCDTLNGWAVGEYGYIYHTSDGGLNWEEQAGLFYISEKDGDIKGGNTLFDVRTIDPVRAWVVGIDNYIARTQDGGTIWEKIETPDIPKTRLFGICLDSDEGTILIGGKDVLLVSQDGGKRFIGPKVDPPVIGGWIYKITPLGSEGFAAVGNNGGIYLGDRKGMNWKRIEIRGGS